MPLPPHEPEENIDELEKLAYLIAEEFVRETELQLADALLNDPAFRISEQPSGETPKLKRRTAGGGS